MPSHVDYETRSPTGVDGLCRSNESLHSTITENDTGKPVVASDDAQIGVISEIEGGTVYVDPEPNLADDVRAILGGEADESFPLNTDALKRDPYADIAVFRVDLDALDRR